MAEVVRFVSYDFRNYEGGTPVAFGGFQHAQRDSSHDHELRILSDDRSCG
ncbi:hypothetical protein BVRB_1g016730 [Beta vulgaris subsp. vulgaris]|nr:hypothetical protein BVRB_1g016730 [Beta vulgaris subsp. vulgaris]